ncbi:helix-turn-helix transcriptional regulator [Fusibacter sp. Q10-2]|uniref:Helix-turn-helix transcriptional regulator n=2 Tax=Fusibacter ferrireducens TaxID=2785058 RepID=A0ABR9ZU13_9FIRM|nr:helix-turn-helix transcriptional regulator [Fusibacter ferrireducens]
MELTQKEVADGCEISRNYYCQIENEVRKPSVPVAKKLLSFLKLSRPFLKLEL